MVDMHAHILPGVDHGSQSVAMSLSLLDAAIDIGVDTIVATPHFYLHSLDSISAFLAERKRGIEALKSAMGGDRHAKCRILCGAEVNLRLGLSKIDLHPLCIEGTNVLLLEMPMGEWPVWIFNELKSIVEQQDVQLLMAHIDRYDMQSVERIFECFPLYAQINTENVISFFGRHKVRRYLAEGYVYALGSDVHRSTMEYKQFSRSKKYLGAYLDEITERSRALLVPSRQEQSVT